MNSVLQQSWGAARDLHAMLEAHAMARWALLSLPLRPAAGLLLPKLLLFLLLHAPLVPAPSLQQGLERVEGLGRKRLVAPPSRDWGRPGVAWHPRVPPWGVPALTRAPALQAWRWWCSRGGVRRGPGGAPARIQAPSAPGGAPARIQAPSAPGGAPARIQAPSAAAHTHARRDSTFLETEAPLAPLAPLPHLAPALQLQVPRNIEDLKRLQRQLLGQLQAEPLRFVCAFSLLYVTLQALTIPGSTILNVAAGCLFGFLPGLLLVTLLVTAGSLASYGLSSVLLCQVLENWMSARLDRLRSQVAAHRDGLLNYLLFLRFSPVVPSWFINAASPVAGVPWRVFALASLLGFLPHTSVQVHAGCVLSTVSSLHDLYSIKVLVVLFLFSLLALLPTFLKANGSPTASRAVSP